MIKKYFLDTNILLHNPDAIHGFGDNIVVITGTVLQELDRHKRDIGETGYNAREAIRTLEKLVDLNSASNKYSLLNGGTLLIIPGRDHFTLPAAYSMDLPDNRIINDVYTDKLQGTDKPVILVSNDIAMRLKAKSLGIHAQAYKNERISFESTDSGRYELDCADIENGHEYFELVNSSGRVILNEEDRGRFTENGYVVMQYRDQSVLAQYRRGRLEKINTSAYRPMGVKPRNIAQVMALDALMAPVSLIPLVILDGPAGTAKTFLATAAGISQTIYFNRKTKTQYSKMIITRNNVLSDAEHGYLPGSLEDKMYPLLAPFYDNMERIFSLDVDEEPSEIRMQIDDLFESGIIEATSMAYIRGRSLSNTYLILDECQNVSRGQMLTLLTRAAEGCKIVVAGCLDQIDNPSLDRYNNGLAYAIEGFKNSTLAAHVSFREDECVRSALAAEASLVLSR